MTSPQIHFVISAPRSGSTWLAQALNQHPEIFATEHRLFGNFCEMWPNNNGKLAPRITFDAYARAVSVHYFHNDLPEARNEFTEKFIKEYCKFLVNFASSSTGKNIIVDKITPYAGTTKFVVEQLSKYFPNSKIFKLVRDGRDVVTSGTFDWLLKDGQDSDRFKCFVNKDSSVEVQRFFDDDSIKKWASNWSETICDVKQFDQEIRYETMLSELPNVLNEIFETLGLANDPTISGRCAAEVTFEKQTGRRNGEMEATAKQRSGTSGGWQQFFTTGDGELFNTIAGKELVSLGYAADESWSNELPQQLSIRHGFDAEEATQL